MRRSLVLVLALQATSAFAATFTVTNTNDSGAGSLRDAITAANAAAGADTIAFNVSGAGCDGSGLCTIAPDSQLPSLGDAVLVDGYTQPGASPNTNATGAINAVLKIVVSGVNIPGAQGFNVQGTGATIRGLVVNGGFSYTFSLSGANGKVQGCFVGTDVTGSTAVPNTRGVYSNGPGSTVGGPLPADRNLIAGNQAQDIWSENTPNLTIQGNLVGTDKSGAALIGAFSGGLVVSPARAGDVIKGNVVAGAHNTHGIYIGGGSTIDFGTVVQGNFVGTDVTGTVNLGNTFNGIVVETQQVTVGGTGAGEGNVIAFNKGAGVFLGYTSLGTIRRNPIRGNSIYSNHQNPSALATQGIDLGESSGGSGAGGLTVNDLGDADTGPNDYQNFPLISSAVSTFGEAPGGGSTTIEGRLNSLANTQFDLDFYSNDGCLGRPQDFLEGRTYLGSSVVTTDGAGNATINAVLPVVLAPGEIVSATATDPEGNTSEFSQRIVVSSNPGSGPAAGAGISLSGFNFLAGATVTVGGLPATSVNVVGFNQITATTPSLPPGSLNNITVSNTDGSAGTLPNGWIADFLDVPGGHQFYSFVTTLVRNAITVGVGGGNYGVAQNTLRQQMAVFLLKARFGICYTPPPCTVPAFPDVPCSSNFAPVDQRARGPGHHRRLRRRQLLSHQPRQPPADGGLPPEGLRRQRLYPARLHRGDVHGRALHAPVRSLDLRAGRPRHHRRLRRRQLLPGTSANRGQIATFIVKTFQLQ